MFQFPMPLAVAEILRILTFPELSIASICPLQRSQTTMIFVFFSIFLKNLSRTQFGFQIGDGGSDFWILAYNYKKKKESR